MFQPILVIRFKWLFADPFFDPDHLATKRPFVQLTPTAKKLINFIYLYQRLESCTFCSILSNKKKATKTKTTANSSAASQPGTGAEPPREKTREKSNTAIFFPDCRRWFPQRRCRRRKQSERNVGTSNRRRSAPSGWKKILSCIRLFWTRGFSKLRVMKCHQGTAWKHKFS